MRRNENFWEKRPLTRQMIQYAAQDVCYLYYAFEKLVYCAREMKLESQVTERSEVRMPVRVLASVCTCVCVREHLHCVGEWGMRVSLQIGQKEEVRHGRVSEPASLS